VFVLKVRGERPSQETDAENTCAAPLRPRMKYADALTTFFSCYHMMLCMQLRCLLRLGLFCLSICSLHSWIYHLVTLSF